MTPLVTVITPTTGNPFLRDAVRSVEKQTYPNLQHLVVIDGQERQSKTLEMLQDSKADIITLPYATGAGNFLGHRIYGAMTYVAKGDFLCFLDEDNWYDNTHIASLVETIHQGFTWAYSLRKIVAPSGEYLCNDDCNSLGKWPSFLNDHLVDTGCFMLPKRIALRFSPAWYRRADIPGQPSSDRYLTMALLRKLGPKKVETTGQYTLNYRLGSRPTSVPAKFFMTGNERMKQRLKGEFPWRKKSD